jgi:hypothetical protein
MPCAQIARRLRPAFGRASAQFPSRLRLDLPQAPDFADPQPIGLAPPAGREEKSKARPVGSPQRERMEIPSHIVHNASFIVRLSAERLAGDSPEAAQGWTVHGLLVLADSGRQWRFADLHALPDILARWLEENRPADTHTKESNES